MRDFIKGFLLDVIDDAEGIMENIDAVVFEALDFGRKRLLDLGNLVSKL